MKDSTYETLATPSTSTQKFPHLPDQPKQMQPSPDGIRQIYSMDDLEVVFEARNIHKHSLLLEILASILTAGIYHIMKSSYPMLRIRLISAESTLSSCNFIVCKDSFAQIQLVPIERQQCNAIEIFDSLNLDQVRIFQYRCTRFIFDPRQNSFVASNQLVDISQVSLGEAPAGISRGEHTERLLLCGKNKIEIPVPSVLKLLHEQLVHPLNVFQLVSFVIWMIQSYWKYAIVILGITLVSIVLTIRDLRRSMRSIKEMSEMDLDVYVSRSGTWRVISYEDLVPGDVFELTSTMTVMPCDAILLDGDCIIDESMLTGESIPVSKSSPEEDVDWESINFVHLEASLSTKSVLFCGTRIIRVRNLHGRPAIAMVARTGFFTAKGSLIRSILFPKPSRFKFYQESINFIKILGLVAVVGFVVVLIFTYKDLSKWNIFQRATDLITVVVPPALPAAMAVATELALRRLKKQRVFCISPPKINVAGKLDLICFDKTGTLTEEGLDVMGVCVFSQDNEAISCYPKSDLAPSQLKPNLIVEAQSLNDSSPVLMLALATCHSIKSVNDEFIGDPLDLKMFEWTNWILEESSSATHSVVSCIVRPPWTSEFDVDEFLFPEEDEESESDGDEGGNGILLNSLIQIDSCIENSTITSSADCSAPNSPSERGHLEYGIIRCFDFVSHLRRMSVIVKELNGADLTVFTKGSPESIKTLLNPSSIPLQYESHLEYYTKCGYRVIALAHRTIRNISWLKAQKMARSDVEANLDFLGFLVFENKIKPVTKGVLSTLHNANIRTLMCTGDNMLTAISVSKECGILADKEDLPVFTSKLDDTSGSVEWVCANSNDPTLQIDPVTLKLKELPNPLLKLVDSKRQANVASPRYELACSGDVFDHLLHSRNAHIFERLLVKCQIFARMNPEQKQILVQSLQQLGYSVGFCGDGANDCGALKAADVGISLSEAEASVAAPFTSNINDIGCVLKVLREGRCSLQTSFSCFKFMSLYVFVQFTTSILLNFWLYRLGDNQFLYVDLVLTLVVAFASDSFKASPTLTKRQPHSRLMSVNFLSELVAHLFVIVGTQLWIYFWSILTDPSTAKADKDDATGNLVTRLFLFSIFQYFLVGLISCPGKPFRQPIYTNWFYCITILLELAINLCLLFFQYDWLIELFKLTKISFDDRITILTVACVCISLCFLIELVILPLWIRILDKIAASRGGNNLKKYQLLENSFLPIDPSIQKSIQV